MKKIVVILMVTMMVISSVSVYGQSVKPVLKVQSVSMDSMQAAGNYTVKIRLKNIGKVHAKDVDFRVTTMEESPLKIETVVSQFYEEEIKPNEFVDVIVTVAVDKQAVAGVYNLVVSGSYTDTSVNAYELNESINIKVEENKQDIMFTGILLDSPEFVEGAKGNIEFEVLNSGESVAKEVKVSLIDEIGRGIHAVNSNSISLGTMTNDSKVAGFEILVDEGIKGYVPVNILIEYMMNGEHHNKTVTNYIKVLEKDKGDVIITSFSRSKSTLIPEERFTASVVLENVGKAPLKNIQFTLNTDSGVIITSQSTVMMEELPVGEISHSFDLKVAKDMPSGNYNITGVLKADNGEEMVTTTSIYVDNQKKKDNSTPRIIIENFEISKEKIYVGDRFDMTIFVKNASDVKAVKNLKVVLSSTGDEMSSVNLLPVNQSSSVYIGELDKEESFAISIPYQVIANAKGGVYNVDFKFEYEDKDFNSFQDVESIFLSVYEQNKLRMSDVRVGKILESGYTLEMDFYNTGKVDIRNMMVDIECDYETNNSNYYVGDFLTGRMDVYEVQIKEDAPEFIEGTIVFTYDDTFGVEEEVHQEFSIRNEYYEEPITIKDGENQGGGGSNPKSDTATADAEDTNDIIAELPVHPGVIVIGLLVLVIIIVVIVRRKKA